MNALPHKVALLGADVEVDRLGLLRCRLVRWRPRFSRDIVTVRLFCAAIATDSLGGEIMENALIAALERAVVFTGVDTADDRTNVEPFSRLVAEELSVLSKPADPTETLSALQFWLRATVTNVAFDQSELERLGRLYELLVRTGCSSEAQGAIGFLLCCRSADRAQSLKTGRNSIITDDTSERVKAAFADANKFLADAAVRGWIASYYGIDRSKVVNPDAEVTVIASGTTSYVIRYDVSEDFVLKLVKPQFVSSPHIKQQTSFYGGLLKAQAGNNSLLPRVQATGSSYIQMELIDGHSLADLLGFGILDTMTTDERRELLFGIIGNLEALRLPHLDLSPGNIMVEILPTGGDKSRRFKVRLIDFGYNYLLREGLSGMPIRNDVVRYSAPEMMAGSYEGSIKADLYSLGMTILDIMRSSPNAVDLSVQLDRCWQDHPQLASIVEELIANDPADRAPWANGLDQAAAYRALRRRLEQEERTTNLIEVRLNFSDAWSGLDGPIREFWRIGRELPTLLRSRDDDTYSANTRYLYWWSLSIKTCLVAALAVCGFYLLQTLDVSNIVPADKSSPVAWARGGFEKFKSVLLAPQESQAVLAGRVMAFIIILVVSQYYNSIFSAITTRSIRTQSARFAEFTIRSTPIGIMLLCVSTTALFPTWWYVTSLIGPLITAANNFAVLNFCRNVRQEAGRRAIVGNLETTDIARFDEMFQRWWKAMIGAGILICAVGLLLRFGVIHDEAFLGLAMAFLCYSALYQSASTDMSALMRGGIARYVKVAERILAARGPYDPGQDVVLSSVQRSRS